MIHERSVTLREIFLKRKEVKVSYDDSIDRNIRKIKESMLYN